MKDERGSNLKRKGESICEDECSVSGSSNEMACFPYQGMKHFAQGISGDSDDMCKEVRCVDLDESGTEKASEPSSSSNQENEGRTSRLMASIGRDMADSEFSMPPPRPENNVENHFTYGPLEQKLQDVQKTINALASPYPDELSPSAARSTGMNPRSLKLHRSQSCRANLKTGTSDNEMEELSETTPPNGSERDYPGRPEGVQRKHWNIPPFTFGANSVRLSRENSQSSNTFIDELKAQENAGGDEDILSVDTFVAGLKEMAKLGYGTQLHDQETESNAGKNVKDIGLGAMPDDSLGASSDWPIEFERMQRFIIELWHTCNVSLIHRTYFFMLFKGDPMDSIYMEVELRRLSYLKETFSKGNPVVQDGRTLTLASSLKALRRERQMLSRLMNKRFTEDDRNKLYQDWGISLNSKQRRLQLVYLLWKDTKAMKHVAESAAIVAKLIRFSEHGQALKEMFGLSFTPPRAVRRSFGWKNSMATLI